jgi:hypothetical protein
MTQEIKFEIVPQEAGLDITAKTSIETAFSGFFQQAAEWGAKADSITDPKEARAARLTLVKLRTSADKTRSEIKAQYLRMSKAIDGANNIFLALVVPIEEKLDAVEKAEERRIAAEKQARLESRTEQVKPFVSNSLMIPPLGDMTDEMFDRYLDGVKLLHKAEIEAAAKAEADRIERERIEAEQREAQRLENIRLKAEAEAREKAMKAEREAAEKQRAKIEADAAAERKKAEQARLAIEAKVKAEAEAREKAEREAKALRDAETKRLADIEAAKIESARLEKEAAKKAAAAPDKAKMQEFAAKVRALVVPLASSESGRQVAAEINRKVESFAKWIEAQSETI